MRERTPTPADMLDAQRSPAERVLLIWDLAIVALVCINLALIVFDLAYSLGPVADGLNAIAPNATHWYGETIHARFGQIDLFFVAVFVADVLAGWTLAIVQKRYHRWYFYPFARWYDVLGCIPVAGFRFLRVLRVISILMRLQRLSVIDIRTWWVYRQLMVYYDIVVEEISDRVVINVLSGAQEEMRSGGQTMTRRVVSDVIAPRQNQLTAAISSQLENAVVAAYQDNREQMQAYVARVVNRAVDANPALAGLERVPMLGRFVSEALDAAIRDTVNHVLDEAVSGLSSAEFDALVADVVDSVIQRTLAENAEGASDEVRDALIETLELVKDQVAIKRWHAHFE
ncbi:ion transporter [Salinisphaera sp. Q1T1-3]|uniref:ion transporter n=1 Tax=Salinisphaera sp. Q1T1-3 TaxID=2321229 RepID=UPI000E72EE4A|nr:ion transporter [Salinisphaera sp. Q1T1-3]RJS92493.1 ion transporter [Salinisphaera sp. Q1T1-3]